MMVEAMTVRYTATRHALSPLSSRFWYLSSLTSGFCGEFPAKSMIPPDPGGEGVSRNRAKNEPSPGPSASARKIYFAAEIHRRAGTVEAHANSRFLHSAVAGAPAPVGMTGMVKVSRAEARS